MINAELSHCKNVKEFYKDIRAAQEEAHGEYYCEMHDKMKHLLENECDTYLELGTHQGGTAANAMLCKPKRIQLVDIDMSRYKKFLEKLAVPFCEKNNIELIVKETDSTSLKSIGKADLMLIDSVHHPNHMKTEFMTHQSNINKYIVAHDTSVVNGKQNSILFETLQFLCKSYPWEIVERGMRNVGYTILKRK